MCMRAFAYVRVCACACTCEDACVGVHGVCVSVCVMFLCMRVIMHVCIVFGANCHENETVLAAVSITT